MLCKTISCLIFLLVLFTPLKKLWCCVLCIYLLPKKVFVCLYGWASGMGTLTCSTGYTTDSGYLVYRRLNTWLLAYLICQVCFYTLHKLTNWCVWEGCEARSVLLFSVALAFFLCGRQHDPWPIIRCVDISLYCRHWCIGKTQLLLFMLYSSCVL